jgi:hypothetical protein
MPAKIATLAGDGYRISTPGGTKAKKTTKKKAVKLQRLLNALDHGWKPGKRG